MRLGHALAMTKDMKLHPATFRLLDALRGTFHPEQQLAIIGTASRVILDELVVDQLKEGPMDLSEAVEALADAVAMPGGIIPSAVTTSSGRVVLAGDRHTDPSIIRHTFEWLTARMEGRAIADEFDALIQHLAVGGPDRLRVPRWLTSRMLAIAEVDSESSVLDPWAYTGDVVVEALSFQPRAVQALNYQGNQGLVETRLALRSPRAAIFDHRLRGLPKSETKSRVHPPPEQTTSGEEYDAIVSVLPSMPQGSKFPSAFADGHAPIKGESFEAYLIRHARRSLRAGGRAVFCVSNRLLFSQGDARFREWLVNDGGLQSVMSLGHPYTNTSLPASLLTLSSKRNSLISFFDSDHISAEVRNAVPEWGETGLPHRNSVRLRKSTGSSTSVDVSTIEANGFDLIGSRFVETGYHRFLEQIVALKEVNLVTIDEIARLESGLAVRDKSALSMTGPAVISAAMIQDGRINFDELFPARGDRPSRTLRPGDILISTRGTIGKIAVYRGTGPAAVAGTTLIRLVPSSSVDSTFLAAILRTQPYQTQLRAVSVGLSIEALRRSDLARIVIPVPPLERQRALASTIRPDFDEADLAGAFRRDVNPLIAALIKVAPRLRALRDNFVHGRPDLTGLHEIMEGLGKHASNKEGSTEVERTLYDMSRAYHTAFGLPAGPERLAAAARLSGVVQRLRGISSTGDEIWDALALLLDHWVGATRRSAGPLLVLSASGPVASARDPLPLTISNEGSLTAHQIWVGIDGTETPICDHLPPGARHSFTYEHGELPPESNPGQPDEAHFDVWFSVGAESVAKSYRLHTSVRFDIGTAPLEDAPPLPPSPYLTGPPLKREHESLFFGREEVLTRLRQRFPATGPESTVMLIGNRRLGKSSILHQIEAGRILDQAWIPAYFSLQEQATTGPEAFFRPLAAEVFQSIRKHGLKIGDATVDQASGVSLRKAVREFVSRGFTTGAPYDAFRSLMELASAAVSPKKLLLLVDEVDLMQREASSPGISTAENLRSFLQTEGVSAILCGSMRVRNLYEDYYGPLFGMGTTIRLGPLDELSARRLVTEPVMGTLRFDEEAVTRIVYLAARQPYLIQCLSAGVYDICDRTGSRVANLRTVEAAAHEYVQEGTHFRNMWRNEIVSSATRFLVVKTHQLERSGERVTFGRLSDELEYNGVVVSDLEERLRLLLSLEILESVSEDFDRHYRLSVPLLGNWIEQSADLDLAAIVSTAQTEAPEDPTSTGSER